MINYTYILCAHYILTKERELKFYLINLIPFHVIGMSALSDKNCCIPNTRNRSVQMSHL